ncbi:MAG: hypothetical protein LBE27_08360 [Deltaproteobacteria bacterium]|nr:hypothetical protein [Deltaproteobacteria bacterium]
MKKLCLSIISVLFMLGAIFAPKAALTEGPNEMIDVWFTNAIFAKGGMSFEFMADGGALSVEIENMTLTTAYGDIVFEGSLSAIDASRYVKGSLMTTAEGIEEFLITAASGTINGKKTDIMKLINGIRQPSYGISTSSDQLYKFKQTIEFYDVDKYFVNALIYYDDISADFPSFTTKQLLESARRVLLDSKMDQTIYNNDTFYYSQEDGVYLLLITDGATQGFKILKLRTYQPKETGEIIFSFTCEIEDNEIQGQMCSKPLIIENGSKISVENAFKSNPIFLEVLKMLGTNKLDNAG